ncbi:uncharacterized protein SPPG_05921 [Spizellomyces punctatus DAOM BR117]|uniref:SEC7 domain-containing protein n=1 Tax=Spizellomyces punctatus (strain DAOM BR117) TaxID=645134 RepID=A0A0L0HBI9_SPIPD|nr:uncharacterized protein SPPG_05921 [Spizellomyces punctatus DAOM BR117]KNC98965.1 hypothetical protein SPPG_05921 [Spizellomyces punctatus DAOM BR117]|eukprot:XP_016607005.1 hypothetical protein SPPG_05921 [Spizellomyces punctatus DAOM BR117]
MDFRNEQIAVSSVLPANVGGVHVGDGRSVFPRPKHARPESHWIYIVQAEIVSVTAAMRKNQRWSIHADRVRREDMPSVVPYDFCQDVVAHGRAHLDALVDFTRGLGPADWGVGGVEENPLLQGFARLRARLMLLNELRDLDPSHLLEPFLEVIRSGDTTGPITGAALSSVEKFITYRVLDPNHPGLPSAMAALTHSVTRCKFEATDAVSDEAVLAKILGLLRVIIQSEAGQKSLDDKGICEMVEVAFGMFFQGRITELLRRSAEQTLIMLVQALFERLTVLVRAKEHEDNRSVFGPTSIGIPIEKGGARLRGSVVATPQLYPTRRPSAADHKGVSDEDHAESGGISPSISVFEQGSEGHRSADLNMISVGGSQASTLDHGQTEFLKDDGPRITFASNDYILPDGGVKTVRQDLARHHTLEDGHHLSNVEEPHVSDRDPGIDAGDPPAHTSSSGGNVIAEETPSTPVHHVFQPFGLPAIIEMLRVLVTLLDPRNKQHTDSMHRTMALTLLHAGLEVGGCSLGKLVSWGFLDEKTSPLRRTPQTRAPAKVTRSATLSQSSALSQEQESASSDPRQSPERTNAYVSIVQDGANVDSRDVSSSRRTSLGSAEGSLYQSEVEAGIPEDGEERAPYLAKDLVVNELCKYLFQLLQNSAYTSTQSPSVTTLTILALTLKCITTLFQSSRQHMKLQLEWFLEWTMGRLDGGVVTLDIEDWAKKETHSKEPWQRASAAGAQQRGGVIVGEARELMLESMAQLCRIPGIMVELYVNYDGDMDRRSHLFEELVTFFAKHSFPDVTPGGPISTTAHQTLCFDALLMVLNDIMERKSHNGEFMTPSLGESPEGYQTSSEAPCTDRQLPPPDSVRFNKARKRVLKEGTDRFNDNPKEGLKFLQAHNFLPDPLDAESLARFLKTTASVNKKLLGEYLSKPKHVDVLKAFVGLYDFGDKRFDEALRLLLESFRLPGESQQIERIMQNFASAYFDAIKGKENHDIETVDATFILAYSVIMLNTDQHNPQVRRRMTLDDFMRNLRGLNGNKDFSPEFLKQMYTAIRENEIVMPEEHEGDLGFNYQWKELMKKAEHAGDVLTCRTNCYDKDMLRTVSDSILSALSYAFDNAEDQLTLQKAVIGYHNCAVVAAHYRLTELYDSLIISLAKMTGMLKETSRLPPDTTMEDTNNDRNARRPIDPWRVEIGRNYRGQVAAVLMFTLVSEYGTCLKSGWRWIIGCLRNLFLHSLLPASMVQVEDFVRGSVVISRLRDQDVTSRKPNAPGSRREAGLLSTLSNFLSLSSSNGDDFDNYEATPDGVEYEKRAIHCVRSCRIEQLFADSRFLEEDTLRLLVEIISQASFVQENRDPEHSTWRRRELEEGQDVSPDGSDARAERSEAVTAPLPSDQAARKYDSAAVFLLELLIAITIQNRDRIMTLWPLVLEHISGILKSSGDCHPVLVERGVTSLLRLVQRLGHKDDMLERILQSLDLVNSLSPEAFNRVAEPLMAGIAFLLKSDPSLVTRNARWEVVIGFLSRTSVHPEASRFSFEATCILVSENADSCVSSHNFSECVDLLISFAAAAGGIVLSSAVASPSGRSTGLIGGESVNLSSSAPTSPRLGSRERLTPVKSQLTQVAIERALRALDKLFKLHLKIPSLVEETGMKFNRAFFEFWLPVLSGLSQQSYHPAREVRQHALTLLQRTLLSPELETGCGPGSPSVWADSFETVLFPMLDELLRPEMTRIDPLGMDETRMRASALLCKIFLQYLPRLQNWKELPQLWIKILDYMRKQMSMGESDYLYEGVQESLKNMLLVMSTQGVFQPSAEVTLAAGESQNLWELTWKYVDSFLPDLKDELFPPPSESMVNEVDQPTSTSATDALASIAAHALALAGPTESPEPQPKPVPVKEVPVEGGSVIMQEDS